MKYVTLLTILFPSFLVGQQQVEIQSRLTGTQEDFSSLYDLTLMNDRGLLDGFIEAEIFNHKNKRIFQAQSKIINIPPGQLMLNESQWGPMSSSYPSADLRNASPGQYRIEYKIFRPGDFRILGQLSEEVTIQKQEKKVTAVPPKETEKEPSQPKESNISKSESQPKAKKEEPVSNTKLSSKIQAPKPESVTKPNKDKAPPSFPIAFSGDGRVTGYYSSRQGTFAQVPASYGRLELFPTLTIGEVPIGANIQLSTEQQSYRQPMNAVSLNFDVRQFQQNMKRRLAEKVDELASSANPLEREQGHAFKDQLLKKQFPKMEEWKEKLDDPNLQSKLNELQELDNLDRVLNNESFGQSAKQLQQLESQLGVRSKTELESKRHQFTPEQYQQMQQLYAFQAQHQELLDKKSKLEKQSRELRKYQKMAEKLNAAENADMRMLLNEKSLKGGLKQFGMNTGAVKVMSSLQEFSIGTSYPMYTPLTMNGGSPVNGIHAAINPGKIIYLAGTFGEMTRQTFDTTFMFPRYTFQRKLSALRAGIGSPEGSHLIASYIKQTDKGDSLFTYPQGGITLFPAEITTVGLDGQVSLFERNLSISGEVAGSLNNRNKNAGDPYINVLGDDDFPLKSDIDNQLNSTSSVDYAYQGNLNARLFRGVSTIRGHVRRVGPGFESASRILLKDIFRWRMEWMQSFLDNKAQLTVYGSRTGNKTTPSSHYFQTEVISYGGSFRLQLPDLPFLSVLYAPYRQENQNEATGQSFENKSQLLNVIAGHNFQVGDQLFLFSQMGFTRFNFESPLSNGSSSTNMYQMTQSVAAGSKINFTLSGTYQPALQIGAQTTKVLTLDLNGSFRLFKTWQNSFGIQYYDQKLIDQRTGFYWTSRYPVTSFANLEARVQQNVYDDELDVMGYRELVAYMVVVLNW